MKPEQSPTPETDKFDADNWRQSSAGWRERSIDLDDALDFARHQERGKNLHEAAWREETELRIKLGNEIQDLRKQLAAAPELLAQLQATLDRIDLIHDMGNAEWDSDDAEIFNQARAILAKAKGPQTFGATCPSCGRDNSEYDNQCTADDCPGVQGNPGCDKCGVNDRIVGNKLCAQCQEVA